MVVASLYADKFRYDGTSFLSAIGILAEIAEGHIQRIKINSNAAVVISQVPGKMT